MGLILHSPRLPRRNDATTEVTGTLIRWQRPLERKGAHGMTTTKLRLNITMSLDGYVAGPNQSTAQPLGAGAEHLHDWLFKLKTSRAIHGDTNGGETGTNDDVLRAAFENIGATIIGRYMFGGGHG